MPLIDFSVSSNGDSLPAHNMPSSDCSSDSDVDMPPTTFINDPGPHDVDSLNSSDPLASTTQTADRPPTPAAMQTLFNTPSPQAPQPRFKNSVHNLIKMQRGSSMMLPGHIGAEPGIDPSRASANAHYGHIRQQCVVEVVDYSTARCSVGRMGNQELVEMLGDPEASKREPWARVRWINVGGVSWDVISALALRYDMHPLAVEDILHQHGRARSKADYYAQHLFLRILCHRLAHEDDISLDASLGHLPVDPAMIPRSASPGPMEQEDRDRDKDKNKQEDLADEDRTVYGTPALGKGTSTSRFSTKAKTSSVDIEAIPLDKPGLRSRPPLPHSSWSATLLHRVHKKEKHAQDWKLIQKLKKGERVNVKLNPVCIFLFRDGTVISISQDSHLDFTAPIVERLRQADTVLRKSADPSILVESLIDLIVDQALEVVDEYQGKILKIEKGVLLKPDMKTVTSLHVLQEDLILHKRTLDPIKTLVYGLRRYDTDRVAALAQGDGWDPAVRPVGFMSDKAKVYLADVYDHLEYILNSLEMFAGVSDNLINYTCNMVSYQMNENMRRLTLVTIIFLPLGFLSGYFGMNFYSMWSTNNNTDLLYWEIAIPALLIIIPLFMWADIKGFAQYVRKRVVSRRFIKNYK